MLLVEMLIMTQELEGLEDLEPDSEVIIHR